MGIEIKEIKINIGDKELLLTPNEIEELYHVLGDFLNKGVTVIEREIEMV